VLTDLRCTHNAGPIDENAAAATQDPLYAFKMDQYGQQYKDIADQIWKKQYQMGIRVSDEMIEKMTQEEITEPL
jgi:hypothetical protein